MKNKLFLPLAALALFFLFSKNINAQCGNTDIAVLNPNKIKAAIPVGGDLFWTRQNGNEGLNFVVPYVPGEPSVSSIFTAGLWLGGYDENGVLGTSCQSYGNYDNRSDFWSGPIDDVTGEVLENGCENFDKVWKVNQDEIAQLILDFEDNQNIDQAIAQNILRWPGQGNPHFESEMGFELPDQELAPFFDRNNNGIYEPLNGEYPVIDEAWPDVIPNELTWCVFNDLQYEIQGETMGNPVGVEVHQLVYGFNCQENENLNHTIFTRHEIINKSGGDATKFRIGLWVDPRLGCGEDDAFGCDSLLNTIYFYNMDEEDGHPNCTEVSGGEPYQGTPPVQAMTYLNRKMDKVVYYAYSNLSVNPETGPPDTDEGHYNYLSGNWHGGIPFTYGTDGYNFGSTDTVNFAFFDNPNNPDGWSNYALNLPEWYHLPISSYGLSDFANEDVTVFDLAFSYHHVADSSHLGNVNVALDNIPSIQSFFDNSFENGCTQIATSTNVHILKKMELTISPNPNDGNFSIFFKNNTQNMSLELFDINGQKLWKKEIPAGQDNIDVFMSEKISSGIYFLKSINKNGGIVLNKLIIK